MLGLVAMKILQVCPDTYSELGGVTVHVRNIAERLARRHDVTVFAVANHELPRFEVKNGVRVERFRCYAPSNAYFFSWEIPLEMRRVQFDVVHGHGYHAFPLHYSALAKRGKFVATPHFHGAGHTPLRDCLIRLFKPFGARTLERAEKIIAVSEFEKALLHRQFKIDDDKVLVIPNGVDHGEFSNLQKREPEAKSILYVGFLTAFKGPQYLVEVLPRLAEDVVLEIVGRGPLRPFLEKRARELRVYDRVRFYENLSRHELLERFAEASVFAMLSTFEAYSIVVAEALTAGTPCVVANTSALSEWVDNETCFGVDYPIDLNQLAKQVNRVLENGVDTTAMRKWIGTKILDWNDVVGRLENVYERIAEE
ncbi:MAG: glycosyltransferase family 4 protein [Candidatus Bathyarchaeia archaeon]